MKFRINVINNTRKGLNRPFLNAKVCPVVSINFTSGGGTIGGGGWNTSPPGPGLEDPNPISSWDCTTTIDYREWRNADGTLIDVEILSVDVDCERTTTGSSSDELVCGLLSGEIPILVPDKPCKTKDEYLDDPVIQSEMNKIWEESKSEGDMAQRLENGGWIIKDAQGGLTFQLIGDDWTKSPCGLDPPSNFLSNIPEGAVGFVHTHPFYRGEDRRNICDNNGRKRYKSGYSIDDLDFIARVAASQGDFGFRGYVLDGNKITKFNSLGNFQMQQYKRCSY